MLACRLATIGCVLSAALCFGQTEPVSPLDRKVVVYLRAGLVQPAQPTLEMKREVNSSMESAGYNVSWRTAGGAASDIVDATLVVLELRGSCQSLSFSEPHTGIVPASSLASTAVVNGELLPFSWVECTTLAEYLSPALFKETRSRRDLLYGRAMGRVVAHELFHILANTKKHDDSGIGKSSFSARDLIGDVFKFEFPALAKLKMAVPENVPATGVNADASSGETSLGR